MRIRVTITYEYDVVPDDYPEDERTPTEMAALDIEVDPAAMLMGEDYTVDAEEVKHG